ncbi:MAG: zinc-dependent metalloprotease [bacterium]
MSFSKIALLLAATVMFGACAQEVGDIDRTQPNRTLKSDLDGEWFVAQTVVDVPTTNYWTFIGDTSAMERIRWKIEEDYVVAFRAYAKIEGSEAGENAADYVESPIAAYPILSHFDVQRSYNASTGEQSNVIDENSSDRPWYERKYMRVDWSNNLITNFDFLSTNLGYTDFQYFVSEDRSDADSLVEGRNADGSLDYFDFTSNMLVEPDFWGCVYSWWGYSAEDCTSANIKLRTSFLKAATDREYEPVQYEDRLMSKFGYFRTERYAYDEWRGIRQTNRKFLANRYNIWDKVWQRDAEGNIATDDEGRPLVIPVADRTAKPIVYYVGQEMPEDLFAASQATADSWDVAYREAVAAAKGISAADVPRMFILCHNPVIADDAPECGEEGLAPRTGDIRYNQMYWVDQFTQAGLLGYGPSGADPLTGEIVFGNAYVYGAEVETYAQYSADLVRLINGDLTETDLQDSQYISDELKRRLVTDPARPKARLGALKNVSVDRNVMKMQPKKAAKMRALKTRGLEKAGFDRDAMVRQKMREAGFDALLTNDEITVGKSRGLAGPSQPATDDAVKEQIRPSNWATGKQMRLRKHRMMEAARRNLYLSAFADDAILGFALENKDETPEVVRMKVREAVYKAVMEHEVGHTLGLRHNFQGSYDSLNYPDNYWELRKENLINSSNLDDLYAMAEPTQAQKEGKMSQFQYSSIMDYGMRFNSDIQGIGKYDIAAIVFGYSAGTYDEAKGVEPGYVHVYTQPGNAKTLLKRYEDPDSLAFPTLLEEYHYTSVAQTFTNLEDMRLRQWRRYNDVKASRATDSANAPVEVHYMFCSDEWVGALMSCDVWDSGADPFEIVHNVIDMYKNYYPLHHYRRDRPFFWSEDVLYSMYSRYFTPLTQIYQNWVFSYFYGTDDARMDNYYIFAATAAFNQLAEVMVTPQIGGYEKDANDVWRLVDYTPSANYDLSVGYDSGRNLYTEYEYDSGYYYFDRVSEVGHFWDFLAASFALTDYETTRLGVDDSADELTYSIPWYLFFEFELTDLFNAIYTQDTRFFGPRNVDGQVVIPRLSPLLADDGNGGDLYFDPATGEEVPAAMEGEPIDLDSSFTQQLYVGMYGMAFFTSNYSLNFPSTR